MIDSGCVPRGTRARHHSPGRSVALVVVPGWSHSEAAACGAERSAVTMTAAYLLACRMERTPTPGEVAHEALLFRKFVAAARSKPDGGATVAISD